MEAATVWVFNGSGRSLPSGVFSTREQAESWIREHRLTGLLTMYRLDVGAYDWATSHGLFTPKKPEHSTAEFIGRFSGGDVHFHYENGELH
jgi:hypothetical protein